MSNSTHGELECTDCPICFETLEPPSRQCHNGHLVCHLCVTKITECPICREKMPDTPIRNLFVDNMLQNLEHSCRNDGCGLKLKLSEMKLHREECLFRTFPYCQMMGIPNCSEETSRATAKTHFDTCHRFGSLRDLNVEVKYQLPKFSDVTRELLEPIVLFGTDQFFVLKCEITGDTISWFVWGSCPNLELKDFLIKLELVNNDNRTLKLKDYSSTLSVQDGGPSKPILELPLSLCYRFAQTFQKGSEGWQKWYEANISALNNETCELIIIRLKMCVQDLRFKKEKLHGAFQVLCCTRWRVTPSFNKTQNRMSTDETSTPRVVHETVTCDNCGITPIVGIRYKCIGCPDFDLCENCEHRGNIHQHHHFVKIRRPVPGVSPSIVGRNSETPPPPSPNTAPPSTISAFFRNIGFISQRPPPPPNTARPPPPRNTALPPPPRNTVSPLPPLNIPPPPHPPVVIRNNAFRLPPPLPNHPPPPLRNGSLAPPRLMRLSAFTPSPSSSRGRSSTLSRPPCRPPPSTQSPK